MAIGLNADTEGAYRASIPSGGAGTLSDGAFTNCFVGVWVYRPSATTTYALTAGGSLIDFQAGARQVALGFNSAGSLLSDLNLQITFNSGGGTGAVQTFASHAGDDYLDEWVYYFILDNATSGQIAGYILKSALGSIADSITRTNDNAGSQFINTLTFGNVSALSTAAMGNFAFARARYASGITTANVLTAAASDSAIGGDWGFWPLADNADTGDDSGNARDLTFTAGLSSETSPVLTSFVPSMMMMGVG